MNDTLQHHGILGMKWGVRRKRGSGSFGNNETKALEYKKNESKLYSKYKKEHSIGKTTMKSAKKNVKLKKQAINLASIDYKIARNVNKEIRGNPSVQKQIKAYTKANMKLKKAAIRLASTDYKKAKLDYATQIKAGKDIIDEALRKYRSAADETYNKLRTT